MRITSGPVSKSLRFFDDDGKDISDANVCRASNELG